MQNQSKNMKPKPELTDSNQIVAYMHCCLCLAELPAGESPQSYQRNEFGFTPRGLQVWCVRHQANVCNIDFEGHQHPAVTTRAAK